MGTFSMLALLLLCSMAVAPRANSMTFSVGGEMGWRVGTQVSMPQLQVGDAVRFEYPEGEHDVCLVSENAYYSCQCSPPYATYTSGNDYIPLTNAGTYYFMCSYPGHCNNGMKLAVTVM